MPTVRQVIEFCHFETLLCKKQENFPERTDLKILAHTLETLYKLYKNNKNLLLLVFNSIPDTYNIASFFKVCVWGGGVKISIRPHSINF